MNIAQHDIEIKRGDDISKLIKFHRVSNSVRTPLDISSLQRIDCHIKSNNKIHLKLSTEDGTIIVKDNVNGEIILDFNSKDTQKLKFEDGEYDLQFVTKSGKVRTVLEGGFTLNHDITIV